MRFTEEPKLESCLKSVEKQPLASVRITELLAQKIRQSSESKGIKLPISAEVKLSQFADDTTLICKDIQSIKKNIMIINN